jgi:hypothetical protein
MGPRCHDGRPATNRLSHDGALLLLLLLLFTAIEFSPGVACKKEGRSDRHFIAWAEMSITLLEGSHASRTIVLLIRML